HQALLGATHNELFAQMSIFVEPALLIRDELVHGHEVTDPVPSHGRVVEAIIAQDADAAADAARALLDDSVADVEKVLTEEHDA
ncbi:MAG: FCD domain-containing protein, partial [Microbacteriaceae bacterium]